MSDRALLEALANLSPREFEHMVASLLEATGYHDVRVQGGVDDRGVDIVCRDTEGRRVAVQCKRYAPTSTVSALTVQHLAGMAVKSRAARAMLVTTAMFTAPARSQAQDFDIELIDGQQLASLIAGQPHLITELSGGDVIDLSVTGYEVPDVPLVLPNFYADRPTRAAEAASLAWLAQQLPETPVISGSYARLASTTTQEVKRAWHTLHELLSALTPEQFRKACVLSAVALWEQHDRPAIRLLENENASIKDYVVVHAKHLGPSIMARCHHLPAEHAVTAEQVDQFIRYAKANGWDTGPYWTTGLFSAGALLRAERDDLEVAAIDGWNIAALWFPDMHWHTEGRDFIAEAQQPGWPEQVLEGTERRGLLRRLFG